MNLHSKSRMNKIHKVILQIHQINSNKKTIFKISRTIGLKRMEIQPLKICEIAYIYITIYYMIYYTYHSSLGSAFCYMTLA
jgi:hypothetical protein